MEKIKVNELGKKLREWDKRNWVIIFLLILLLFVYYVKDTQLVLLAIQTIILGITAIVIYQYTHQMTTQTNLLRTSQNLKTLSDLIAYFDKYRDVRQKVFKKEKLLLSEATKLCNSLDSVGHITYRLPREERKVAIEQWAETYIRCWIRLKLFVEDKRACSIGRDYAFFEWLASESLRFQKENFPGPMHFYEFSREYYDFSKGGFRVVETYEHEKNGLRLTFTDAEGKKHSIDFRSPEQVQNDFEAR